MQKGTPPDSLEEKLRELSNHPKPKVMKMCRYRPEYRCDITGILIECEKKHTPDCIFGLLPGAPILESDGCNYLTAHGRYHFEIEIPEHNPNAYRRNLKCSYMSVFCNCYSCFIESRIAYTFFYDEFFDDNPGKFFEKDRHGKKKSKKEVEQRTKEFKVVAKKMEKVALHEFV